MLAIVLRILISLEIVLYATLAVHLLDASPVFGCVLCFDCVFVVVLLLLVLL